MAYRIHPRVAWQLLDGEAVLIDLEGGQALGLNEAGTFLWSRAEGSDPQTLTRELAATFAIDERQAGRDVAAFLAGLEERGFLEVVDAEAGAGR